MASCWTSSSRSSTTSTESVPKWKIRRLATIISTRIICSIGGEYDYELLESSALMPVSYGYSFYLPAGETVRCRFLILADKQAEDVEVRNDPSICAFFPA